MFTIVLVLTFPLVVYLFWYFCGIVLSYIDRNRECQLSNEHYTGKVAFLYLTCNDFNPSACSSLINQKSVEFDLFVLDDSTEEEERDRINKWASEQIVNINVVRRSGRDNYKAGNINHWLEKHGNAVTYPYMLIVDSDEHLPVNFTQNLLTYFTDTDLSFVQACHIGTADTSTLFQKAMHPQVECDWLHQVPARNIVGIPPMLGHGVIIKTEKLLAVGGFPNLVSEDLALTICFAEAGFRGVIASNVVAREEFPPSFLSYWIRRKRTIEADIQIIKNMLRTILACNEPMFSKLDLLAREARLAISSLFWVILFCISVSHILRFNNSIAVSTIWYVAFPLVLITFMPALFIRRISVLNRILYVLSASFTGASVCSLSIVHTLKGLCYPCVFEPTGNRYRDNALITPSLFWDIFSSLTFILGGIISQNYSLIAMGLAVGFSPLMRTRLANHFFILGVSSFWILIICQISIDLASTSFPIEHLIVLVGISDSNWG